ncbi:MAG: proton-conducting transporter membrane subunit [Negativicutes bacterium]|jgi:hydrogenase-4 component B
MTDSLLLLILTIYLLAIATPVVMKKQAALISSLLGAIGSALVGVVAVLALLGGAIVFHVDPVTVYGNLSLNIDALAAFFLLLTSIVGIAVSVYGMKYIELNDNPRVLAALGNLFLLLLFLIFSVDNSLEFLFVWEMMALTTFLLINHNYADIKVKRAAWIYFVAAQFGAVFIIAAFTMLYSCYHSFDFSVYKLATVDSRTSIVIFLFAFIGFSIKAGIVPAHGWLPAAHAAAPGNISALLSAVMLKMALYGLIRFAFQFCVLDSYVVALVVIAFGLLSALYGIYLSLHEQEIKRVLACSSIENMGLIFALIGVSLLYKILGYNTFAVLAFAAALLHALNHALIKGSLFLCASTVLKQTHQGNIEQLGGLMKRLPLVGWTFVLSGIAICGVPLFNCFISEWLMFKCIVLLTSVIPGPVGKTIAIISLLAFAVVIAMVVVSFTRLLGVSFFGTPRSQYYEFPDYGKLLVVPQQILLGVALIIGLLPGVIALVFADVIGKMQIFDLSGCTALSGYFRLYGSGGNYAIILPLIITLIFAYIVTRLITAVGGRRTVSVDETWCCGNIPDKNMQYSARGISQPLLRIMSNNFGRMFENHTAKIIERLNCWSGYVRRMQSGNLHEYVTYILAVTVILLIVVVFI